MDALKAIKMQLSKSEKLSLTENGDTAYKSTGSACLDFFSLCGAMRKNISDLVKLFTKAYAENPVIAVKILFICAIYAADLEKGILSVYCLKSLLNPIRKRQNSLSTLFLNMDAGMTCLFC